MKRAFIITALLAALAAAPAPAFMDAPDIGRQQAETAAMPVGERIAMWAEGFVGAPYDPDPLGIYVTRKSIVADDAVDCMYHTFRSVELALSKSPEDAETLALDLRFRSRGVIINGTVANYEDRFEYGEDMLFSGKWGRDITSGLAPTVEIEGSRGIKSVNIIPVKNIPDASKKLKSGDIVYFIKPPDTRIVGEIVGHIGIIKREGDDVYLIHASGSKNKGGIVKKVPFLQYTGGMKFIGIMAGRME